MIFENISAIFADEMALAGFEFGFCVFVLAMIAFNGSVGLAELVIALVRRFIYPGKKKED